MSALWFLLSLVAPIDAPWERPPSFAARWIGEARLSRAPERIVTVAPSITEIVFAMGQGRRVVGVTRFDDFPPEVERLPRIGGFLDPNVEHILALRADLVIAAPNASNRVPLAKLSALGTPVLVVPGNGFADLFHAIDEIGAALDVRADAALLRARLEGELRALRAEARAGVRVAVVYDRSPLIVAGPGSFADTLLTIVGAENVVRVPSEYPSYAREQLLTDAPELIVDASLTHWSKTSSQTPVLVRLEGERFEFWSKLPTIPAVARRRVYGVTGSELLRPGPRLTIGVRRLAEVLREASSGAQ